MKSKKGLSGIVMTIILIALVLVAAAIVWAIVSNLLEGKSEDITIADKCLGLNIKATYLGDCDTDSCDVILERAIVSDTGEFDGLGLTFSSATETGVEKYYEDDIAASKTLSNYITGVADAIKVDVRVYFENEAEERVFCSLINTYP